MAKFVVHLSQLNPGFIILDFSAIHLFRIGKTVALCKYGFFRGFGSGFVHAFRRMDVGKILSVGRIAFFKAEDAKPSVLRKPEGFRRMPVRLGFFHLCRRRVTLLQKAAHAGFQSVAFFALCQVALFPFGQRLSKCIKLVLGGFGL